MGKTYAKMKRESLYINSYLWDRHNSDNTDPFTFCADEQSASNTQSDNDKKYLDSF